MRMIVEHGNHRRYGPTGVQVICIIAACMLFVLALSAALPDS
jgi:hypothetical protein